MHRVTKNKGEGDAFEEVFEIQARLSGLFYEKNHLTAIYIPNKPPLIKKSELDYKLISQRGVIGFFDCKSFLAPFFTYSDINPFQLKRATHYNDWFVPSGFVVWLREVNRVVFYSGHLITQRGPRSRFTYLDGLTLGPFERFNLKLVLSENASNIGLSPRILQSSP